MRMCFAILRVVAQLLWLKLELAASGFVHVCLKTEVAWRYWIFKQQVRRIRSLPKQERDATLAMLRTYARWNAMKTGVETARVEEILR